MKFIMMVLITSCEPKRALSTPGIAPQTRARRPPPRAMHERHAAATPAGRAKVMPDPGRRERGDVELAFGADVEQAAAERHAPPPAR